MTHNSFRTWLRQTTLSLQEYEADPQEIDCIAAATLLAEARRQAVELCLPDVAKLCTRSDALFPVGRAIKILTKCLQLLDSLDGPVAVVDTDDSHRHSFSAHTRTSPPPSTVT
jgi:hypothetical protein